jgi:hypothetical protein
VERRRWRRRGVIAEAGGSVGDARRRQINSDGGNNTPGDRELGFWIVGAVRRFSGHRRSGGGGGWTGGGRWLGGATRQRGRHLNRG